MWWSLAAASLAALSTSVEAISAGTMEFDLLFPRDNETYAPNANMPVVFGIRNPAYGQYLQPSLSAKLQNTTVIPDLMPGDSIWADIGFHVEPELKGANWTSNEQYFAYSFNTAFRYEANWTLSWRAWLTGCEPDSDGVYRGHTVRRLSEWQTIRITTKKGGMMPDLVAATANGRACYSTASIIAVSDKVYNVTEPPPAPPMCAVLDLGGSPTTERCSVTIDSAAAASISAAQVEHQCNGNDAPADCPPKPSPTFATKKSAAAQRPPAVVGAASFAGVLGAVFAGLLWA